MPLLPLPVLDLGLMPTRVSDRYNFLTKDPVDETKHRQCPDSCVASRLDEQQPTSTQWQPHDGAVDGRLFSCGYCGAQACVTCDRPEHHGRSCGEFTAQVLQKPQNLEDEAMTENFIALMFADAEFANWPACDAGYAKGAGCEYLQCAQCQWRFCGECFAPWVGPNGEYIKGGLAHTEECRFRR